MFSSLRSKDSMYAFPGFKIELPFFGFHLIAPSELTENKVIKIEMKEVYDSTFKYTFMCITEEEESLEVMQDIAKSNTDIFLDLLLKLKNIFEGLTFKDLQKEKKMFDSLVIMQQIFYILENSNIPLLDLTAKSNDKRATPINELFLILSSKCTRDILSYFNEKYLPFLNEAIEKRINFNNENKLLFNDSSSRVFFQSILSGNLTERLGMRLLSIAQGFTLLKQVSSDKFYCILFDLVKEDVNYYPSRFFFVKILQRYGKLINLSWTAKSSFENNIYNIDLNLIFCGIITPHVTKLVPSLPLLFTDWLKRESIRDLILEHNQQFDIEKTRLVVDFSVEPPLFRSSKHERLEKALPHFFGGKIQYNFTSIKNNLVDQPWFLVSLSSEEAGYLTDFLIRINKFISNRKNYNQVTVNIERKSIEGDLDQLVLLFENGKLSISYQEEQKKVNVSGGLIFNESHVLQLTETQQAEWRRFIEVYSCEMKGLSCQWNQEKLKFEIIFPDKMILQLRNKNEEDEIDVNNVDELKKIWKKEFGKLLKSSDFGSMKEKEGKYIVKPLKNSPPLLTKSNNLFAIAIEKMIVDQQPQEIIPILSQMMTPPLDILSDFELEEKGGRVEENEESQDSSVSQQEKWLINLLQSATGVDHKNINQSLFQIIQYNNELKIRFTSKLISKKEGAIITSGVCRSIEQALKENYLHSLVEVDEREHSIRINNILNINLDKITSPALAKIQLLPTVFNVNNEDAEKNKDAFFETGKKIKTKDSNKIILNIQNNKIENFLELANNLLKYKLENCPNDQAEQEKFCKDVYEFYRYFHQKLNDCKPKIKMTGNIYFKFEQENFQIFYKQALELITGLAKSESISKNIYTISNGVVSLKLNSKLSAWKELWNLFNKNINISSFKFSNLESILYIPGASLLGNSKATLFSVTHSSMNSDAGIVPNQDIQGSELATYEPFSPNF